MLVSSVVLPSLLVCGWLVQPVLACIARHGMEWNGKWNGTEISVWNLEDVRMEWNGRFQEWNGMEDFKNEMEDNLPISIPIPY